MENSHRLETDYFNRGDFGKVFSFRRSRNHIVLNINSAKRPYGFSGLVVSEYSLLGSTSVSELINSSF